MAKKQSSKVKTFYPPVGFHFEVKIIDSYDGSGKVNSSNNSNSKGKNDASFKEVSGINVEIPIEELYEGGENRFAYKLPLPIKYTPLQLKRGLVPSLSALGEWCRETFTLGLDQPIKPKSVLVSLLDEKNSPLIAWVFVGAYPVKWNVSNFHSMENEIVIETMEMAYRRFEQVKV